MNQLPIEQAKEILSHHRFPYGGNEEIPQDVYLAIEKEIAKGNTPNVTRIINRVSKRWERYCLRLDKVKEELMHYDKEARLVPGVRKVLHDLLADLTPMECDVVIERGAYGKTWEQVSKLIGEPIWRVRSVYECTLSKLRRQIKERGYEDLYQRPDDWTPRISG